MLNNNKFTLINVCFQHKHNEEIGIFWQALFIFLLIDVLCLGSYTVSVWPGSGDPRQRRAEQQKKAVFDMTLSYGNRKLLDGEIESAIKEFKHALKIFPNSLEATVGLAKSYVLDCETNQSNCEKAKKLLDALIEKYPENYEYISYRFSLE